ncbi:hypothetical protein [Pantoea vagans]|uniref:hypothetical protein n=1 Tax=Pantoea vagans TaxID=470934 RepID=UPI003FA3474E
MIITTLFAGNIAGYEWLFHFDRSYMNSEAAVSGIGLIFESELLAKNYLRSGKLFRVLTERKRLSVSARHPVIPHGIAAFLRIAHFLSWIQHEIRTLI